MFGHVIRGFQVQRQMRLSTEGRRPGGRKAPPHTYFPSFSSKRAGVKM